MYTKITYYTKNKTPAEDSRTSRYLIVAKKIESNQIQSNVWGWLKRQHGDLKSQYITIVDHLIHTDARKQGIIGKRQQNEAEQTEDRKRQSPRLSAKQAHSHGGGTHPREGRGACAEGIKGQVAGADTRAIFTVPITSHAAPPPAREHTTKSWLYTTHAASTEPGICCCTFRIIICRVWRSSIYTHHMHSEDSADNQWQSHISLYHRVTHYCEIFIVDNLFFFYYCGLILNLKMW